jgi:RND family efflux transporter MFP subunit
MTRTTVVLMLAFLLGVTAIAAVTLARRGDATDLGAPTAVAIERTFTPRITASGSVRLAAGARVAVGAQVSGVVRRLAVTQGARVHRGDLIAVLDDREARARMDDAEARIRQLVADSAQAAQDADRLETLFTTRSTTDQELLAARTARARSVAQLVAARAARELAAVTLDHTVIRAPLDGIVASVSTHEGETVASSFSAPTFVTIVDPARLECVAIVDETDIGRVRSGQEAEFTVDAFPGRTFTGVVTRVAPDATIIGGVVDYEVTIRITSPLDGLKPQMTANVTVAVDSRRALVVPTTAVRQGTDGLYVWRLTRGTPARVVVLAGARQLDVTEIRSGLAAGDTVLTGGFPEGQPPR